MTISEQHAAGVTSSSPGVDLGLLGIPGLLEGPRRAAFIQQLMSKGRIAEAIGWIRELVAAHPGVSSAYLDLGRLYRAGDVREEAARATLRGHILGGFKSPVAPLFFDVQGARWPLGNVLPYLLEHVGRGRAELDEVAFLWLKRVLSTDTDVNRDVETLRRVAERTAPVSDVRVLTPVVVDETGPGPAREVEHTIIDSGFGGSVVAVGSMSLHPSATIASEPERTGLIRFRRDRPTVRFDRAFLLGEARSYFHWMVQVSRNLRIYQDLGLDVPLIFAGPTPPHYVREILDRLGIADRLRPALHLGIRVECDKLHVTDHVLGQQVGANGVEAGWLRSVFLGERPARADGPRRLFVSRQDTFKKRVDNEAEIEAALARIGFVTIAPGNHTVAEQARLFLDADIIVGGHGAGLTNMIFCGPDTRVVELATDAEKPRDVFVDLAARIGLLHQLVLGTPVVALRGTPRGMETALPQCYDIDALIERIEARWV